MALAENEAITVGHPGRPWIGPQDSEVEDVEGLYASAFPYTASNRLHAFSACASL
jgi:hypothetical protein